MKIFHTQIKPNLTVHFNFAKSQAKGVKIYIVQNWNIHKKVLKSQHIESVQMYPILVYKEYYDLFVPAITDTVVRKNLKS